MPRSINKRFVIAIPDCLAVQISAICEADRLNHPDFSARQRIPSNVHYDVHYME